MFKPMRKTHPLIKPITNAIIDLPTPANLSAWWNFGSLLGLCLMIQLTTGLFLSMHYSTHMDLAFSSVAHISRDVNHGWLLRAIHANGASWFFICLYLHVGRGIYYGSYLFQEAWNVGIMLLLLTMATAFVGYVLVWGQMSFWGATVITNLLSALPYIGPSMVEWVWGGFAVDNATLNRFFAFHFILPFVIAALSLIHIIFLHVSGGNNPLGLSSNQNKIPFHPFYTNKDLFGFMSLLFLLILVSLLTPNFFTDPENFIPANPLITPLHIKPEWYFLWAYAILRSIPNKLGGVLAMFAAILILLLLPYIFSSSRRGLMFYPMAQLLFWTMVMNLILLTWIGGQPVEAPYETLGQLFTSTYFIIYFLLAFTFSTWDNIID